MAHSRRQFNILLASMAAQAVEPGRTMSRTATSGRIPFAHPGMLQSSGDLRRMCDAVGKQRNPVLQGFERLRDDPHSQLTYKSDGASAEIGRNPDVRSSVFDSDSSAAYQCAIMGHLTGDVAYFAVSRRILDDWSATLKRVTGADAILCAALGGFKMANAAELLRYRPAQWTAEHANQFGRMLTGVILPVINGFAPFANGNWDTAAIKTMMAIAIYTDDRTLFDRALVYYMHGCGDGSIGHYIYSNGQCQESGRDQQHTQLGLGHMGDCCEMAWHQGLDLYGVLDNRLLLGFEYTARYILGEDVPFRPDQDRTGKYKHVVIAERSHLRPNYEQIYNHYANRRGVPAPWTQKAAESVRPEGAGFNADATGFGTLLYSRPSGPDFAEAASVAAVSGIYVAPAQQGVELSWVPLAQAASYHIERTGRSPAHPLVINSRQSIALDSTARSGSDYLYRVSALQGCGVASVVRAFAGMPPGWRTSQLGTSVESTAFFDGTGWRIAAAGLAPPHITGGTGVFVHKSIAAFGEVTACLSPQFASQSLHAGIALLGESADAVMMLLEPTQTSTTERVAWMVRLYTREVAADAIVVGQQPLQEPAVQYGRVQSQLRFRLKRSGSRLDAAFSFGDDIWNTLGDTRSIEGPLQGGMVLNSGLGEVSTEVIFTDVDVR